MTEKSYDQHLQLNNIIYDVYMFDRNSSNSYNNK